MIANAIAVALAIDLLLVCAGGLMPVNYLPLGGSHLAQIGCVLAIAVAISELYGVFK
jgi:hypothetical protein